MTSIEWLAAIAFFTALLWIPYILERMVSLGMMGALKTVEPEDELKQALWARRTKRAHYNAIENLAVFATLVLCAFAMGMSENETIVMASQVYFWARVVHYFTLMAGLPVVRTVAYLGGLAAQLAVGWVILF